MIDPIYVLLIFMRMIFALYVGAFVFVLIAALIHGRSEGAAQRLTSYYHRHRTYKDSELLQPGFDIRDRSMRHAYYRSLIKSKALQLYRDGWVGKLWTLWQGTDAVEEGKQ